MHQGDAMSPGANTMGIRMIPSSDVARNSGQLTRCNNGNGGAQARHGVTMAPLALMVRNGSKVTQCHPGIFPPDSQFSPR